MKHTESVINIKNLSINQYVLLREALKDKTDKLQAGCVCQPAFGGAQPK